MSSEVARSRPLARFWHPVALVAVMWVIRALDTALPGSFNNHGLRSWDLTSVYGLAASPMLHTGWPHLMANSVPLLILGCLVAIEGARRFWLVTVIVALLGGVGTWVVNPPGVITVGASVLVFGYFGYVVARAFFIGTVAHRLGYAVIAIGVIVFYGGSMVGGVLPLVPGISWQAHLFGAIGGVAAAMLLRSRDSVSPDRPAAADGA